MEILTTCAQQVILNSQSFRYLAENTTSNEPTPCNCKDILNGTFDREHPELALGVYIVGILMVFIGIAVVCDDYFCVSLEVISEKLELTPAVAGATFMAAGSSAPELATSLVTVFTTKDATGLGTILGSAVFNLVMIVCVSGIFGNGPSGAAKEKARKGSWQGAS